VSKINEIVIRHQKQAGARGAQEQKRHALREFPYPIKEKLMGFVRLNLAHDVINQKERVHLGMFA
jgi:hypothetical protein